MKVLTCWQPWASLVAYGHKTVETRRWATSHRGTIGIHAAAHRLPYSQLPPAVTCPVRGRTPRGVLLATCTLVDVVPVEALVFENTARVHLDGSVLTGFGWTTIQVDDAFGSAYVVAASQVPLGDFRPGRYAWLLDDVELIDPPIPLKGRQGMWDWTPPC